MLSFFGNLSLSMLINVVLTKKTCNTILIIIMISSHVNIPHLLHSGDIQFLFIMHYSLALVVGEKISIENSADERISYSSFYSIEDDDNAYTISGLIFSSKYLLMP